MTDGYREFPAVWLPEDRVPRDTVSQTFLKYFNACRRSAFLSRLHSGGPRAHEMERGSGLHRILERATLVMIEQGEIEIPPEVVKVITNEVLADPDLAIPIEEHDRIRVAAWRWARETRLDLSALVAVEATFEWEVAGWTVRGRLDRASVFDRGQRAEVVDYKSGFGMPAYDDVAIKRPDGTFAAKQFQLILYGLLMAFGHPEGQPPVGERIQHIDLGLVFPLVELEDGSMGRRDLSLTRIELAEYAVSIEGLLGQVNHAIEHGDWPAVSSTAGCGECPASSQCPIPAELRDHRGEINEMDEASEAAEMWYRRQAENAALKRELKNFANYAGPIPYGADRVLEFATREAWDTDWDGLEVGVERAVEFGESFSLDAVRRRRTSTSFVDRRLKPAELVERDHEQRGVGDEGARVGVGGRFGDSPPF